MARPRPSENTSNAENLAKEIIQLGQSKNFKELEKLIGKNDIPVVSIHINIKFYEYSNC